MPACLDYKKIFHPLLLFQLSYLLLNYLVIYLIVALSPTRLRVATADLNLLGLDHELNHLLVWTSTFRGGSFERSTIVLHSLILTAIFHAIKVVSCTLEKHSGRLYRFPIFCVLSNFSRGTIFHVAGRLLAATQLWKVNQPDWFPSTLDW